MFEIAAAAAKVMRGSTAKVSTELLDEMDAKRAAELAEENRKKFGSSVVLMAEAENDPNDIEAVTKLMIEEERKNRVKNEMLQMKPGLGKAAMMAKRRWGLAKQVLESKRAELAKSVQAAGAFKDIVAMVRELHQKAGYVHSHPRPHFTLDVRF